MGFAEKRTVMSFTNDTEFRAWVGNTLALWAEAGWTRTTTPGQIAPATVTLGTPASGDQVGGFAAYRFNDDMQASSPVVWKVEFGRNGTASYPRLWLTVGKSITDAGVITGVLLPRVALAGQSTGSYIETVGFLDVAGAGPGWVGYLPQTDASTSAAAVPEVKAKSFIIERSRDTDGTPMADGLMIAYENFTATGSRLTTAGNRPAVRAINYIDGSYTESIPPVSVPYSINGTALGPGTSLAAGSIGPVFPWVLIAPGLAPWQSCAMLCIPAGDYPAGVFKTTLCGNEATFRSVPASRVHAWGQASAPGSTNVSGYIGPAIRWEP